MKNTIFPLMLALIAFDANAGSPGSETEGAAAAQQIVENICAGIGNALEHIAVQHQQMNDLSGHAMTTLRDEIAREIKQIEVSSCMLSKQAELLSERYELRFECPHKISCK